jgi:hypothetical protein
MSKMTICFYFASHNISTASIQNSASKGEYLIRGPKRPDDRFSIAHAAQQAAKAL